MVSLVGMVLGGMGLGRVRRGLMGRLPRSCVVPSKIPFVVKTRYAAPMLRKCLAKNISCELMARNGAALESAPEAAARTVAPRWSGMRTMYGNRPSPGVFFRMDDAARTAASGGARLANTGRRHIRSGFGHFATPARRGSGVFAATSSDAFRHRARRASPRRQ